MTLTEALRLFQVISQAVQYAHNHNVIHSDLKPANVLLTEQNQPVLADFGVSRIIGAEYPIDTGLSSGASENPPPVQLILNPITIIFGTMIGAVMGMLTGLTLIGLIRSEERAKDYPE